MEGDRKELRIGVYVGTGASHSWTWFVDLLEAYGYGRLLFLTEENFGALAPRQDVLLVSGGDTFAVAHALRPSGAPAIREFLERGGLYVGSCAGAYLPLHSSKEPLNTFNFVRSRINNLTRDLPPVHRLPTKFSNRYGCAYIYHPVREEVLVRMTEDFPVWGGREIAVPLYGGPPLNPSEEILPRAHYTGFTDRTRFLTEREIAERVYLGKVAACEKRFGAGRMVLLGPHFEHPWFPEGNDVVHQWIQLHFHPGRRPSPPPPGGLRPKGRRLVPRRAFLSAEGLKALKREISNMRIRAEALTRHAVHWKIGAKFYEPEKILHFVDAVWKRLRRMEPVGGGRRPAEGEEGTLELASACHRLLRELGARVQAGEETQELAEEIFASLKALVVAFLEPYFDGSLPGGTGHAGRWVQPPAGAPQARPS